MGLTGYHIPTTEVDLPGGGSFTVRGAGLADVMVIAQKHGPAAVMLFNQLATNGGEVTPEDVKTIIRGIIPTAPAMVAEFIAMVADEHSAENIATVQKLPFPVQVEALMAVFHLTFTTEAELKKLVGAITEMFVGATGLLEQVSLPLSEAGYGASAGK